MPSRKRAKGKARKAKKNILFQHGPHECTHGCSEILSENDVCYRFLVQVVQSFNDVCLHYDETETDFTIISVFSDTINPLQKSNQFNEVFNDEAIQKKLLPHLLGAGTDYLRKDEDKNYYLMLASVVAITAVFCQHNFNEKDVLASKDREVYRDLAQGCLGTKYDTVKFFTKRIPCNCLKGMYSSAKSEPKLMMCNSCGVDKERTHLYLCGGCRWTHYCSVECQKAHYSVHCSLCKKFPRRP